MDLILLGASVRAAAASARRAGFRPVGLDAYADLDLQKLGAAFAIDPNAPTAQIREILREAPDGPIVYTGPIENRFDLLDRLADSHPIWGNPAAVLVQVRDPFWLARVLDEAGLPALPVRDAPAGLPTDGSWLVKPRASGGGLGIEPWNGTVPDTLSRYWQRRQAGQPISALYLTGGAQTELLGITWQLLGAPGAPFAYVGSVGPIGLEPATRGRLVQLGKALVRAFGLCGLFGIDAIVDDEGTPWLVELNPRYTASAEILELALRRALLGEHAAVFPTSLPARPPLPAEQAPACLGKRVLFARRDLTAPDLSAGLPDPGHPWRIPRLADLPRPGVSISAHRPILTLFATGDTPAQVLETLEHEAQKWDQALHAGTSPALLEKELASRPNF